MTADGAAVEAPAGIRQRAVTMAAGLLAREELRPRPGATLQFEVPYSRRLGDGRVERGTMDCVVFEGDAVLVLEFKTGLAQSGHSAQLDAYVDAARAAYPLHRVEGRLLYVPES